MSEWKPTPLGQLGRWRTGKTPKTAEPANWGEDVEFVTPGDLSLGGELGSVARKISNLGVSGSVLFSPPSVLLCCIGTIGKVNWSPSPVSANQQINGLEVNQEVADARFVSLLLASPGVQEKLWADSSGTTVAIINKSKIERIVVSVPPIDEQKRIVAKLDEAQRQIDQLTSNLDLQIGAVGDLGWAAVNEQINRGQLTDASLRPSDLDISSTADPAVTAWPMIPLGRLCEILDSKRKPISKPDRVLGEIPYFGASGVLDYVDSYIFEEKLVLLGEDGAKWNRGDRSAFIIEGKSWVNNHVHVLRPNRDLILDEWLTLYLVAINMSEFITGVTVPKLNQARMREIRIPLPSLDEQTRIVAKLDDVHQALAVFQSTLDDRRSLALSFRERTLAAAFAGDL